MSDKQTKDSGLPIRRRGLLGGAAATTVGAALGCEPNARVPYIGSVGDRIGIAYRASTNSNLQGSRIYVWFPL